MTNAGLIAALRYHADATIYNCDGCPYQTIHKTNGMCIDCMMIDAADALEAAEKRIAELEAKAAFFDAEKLNYQENIEYRDERIKELEALMPKEGEWQWLSSTYDRVPREMRYWCSVCHHEEITHYDKPWKHYCPNCGARMRTVTDCHTLEEANDEQQT